MKMYPYVVYVLILNYNGGLN